MAQTRRSAPPRIRETPSSILMNSITDRAIGRADARRILSIAERFRRVRTVAQRRQVMSEYVALSPSHAETVCDILGAWNSAAPSRTRLDSLSNQQAIQISQASQELPRAPEGRLTETLRSVRRYVENGHAERVRKVGASVPTRAPARSAGRIGGSIARKRR